MKPQLTKKQKKLLDYLNRELHRSGTAPSLRTAAGDLGVSHAAVSQTIKTLEDKGYIQRQGRYSRTIHILDHGGNSGDGGFPGAGEGDAGFRHKRIPIVGRITAGLPIYATQEWEGSLLVDSGLYPGDNLFALKIQGQSMKNAGILNRDIVICRPRQYARNREIVVALVRGEEATVKRFFLHPEFIELRPENPEFAPQTYDFDEVLIQGKVVGLIRPADAMEAE
ncbi:MAG: transcriptional repressor LexA [Desulfobacter sp.]|nr:MAG: transcriptional repressor LexA [Desulfobacter sp.]